MYIHISVCTQNMLLFIFYAVIFVNVSNLKTKSIFYEIHYSKIVMNKDLTSEEKIIFIE